MADRNISANRKPAFWSSKIHGIPQNYNPKQTDVARVTRPSKHGHAVERRTTAIKKRPNEGGKMVVGARATVKLIDTVTSELKRKVPPPRL